MLSKYKSNISLESKAYYYLHNEHSDVTSIVDEENTVKNKYEYDVFGDVTVSEESVENDFKYYEQQLDNETHLYYLRARYYNPTIGRFTQEDVYRGDGLNLYAYVKNNTIMWVDPSGYNGTKHSLKNINDLDDETAKKIEQAKKSQIQTNNIAAGNNISTKTVASDGQINTLSGWSKNYDTDTFERVSTQDIKTIDHDIVGHEYDQNIFGQYYASHAEKQISLLTDAPIGISKNMCPDCQDYFSKLAQSENIQIVTADPNTIRLFNIDGSIDLFGW